MRNLIVTVFAGALLVASAPSFAVDQNDVDLAKLNADYRVQRAREAEAEAAQARAEAAQARAEAAKARADADAAQARADAARARAEAKAGK